MLLYCPQDYMREQGKVYWQPQPGNDNRRDLPENVFDIARPYEHAFDKAEQDRLDLFELEKDLLKKAQADQRIQWFKDGKQAFRDARQEAYREVREEWKPHWAEYYKEKTAAYDDLVQMAKDTREKIHQARQDGDAVRAIGLQSEINIAFAEHTTFFDDIKKNLYAMQREATKDAQEVAYFALRAERDESYKDLLTAQQVERGNMRALHAEGELSKLGDTNIAETLWAARSHNDNANPFATPPVPANDQKPPHETARAANDTTPARGEDHAHHLAVVFSITEDLMQTFGRDPLPNPDLPPRLDAADLASSVLGSVANYVADQMADLITPPSPQELKARGDAADHTEAARQIAREESDARILKHVNEAIRQTEEQDRQKARDDDWWRDRQRKRDR